MAQEQLNQRPQASALTEFMSAMIPQCFGSDVLGSEDDITRTEKFYKHKDAIKIDSLTTMRLHFLAAKLQWGFFIFKRMPTGFKNSAATDVFMCIPANNALEIADIIVGFAKEVLQCPVGSRPPSLQTPGAYLCHERNEESYWQEPFAKFSSNGKFGVRLYEDTDLGIYRIRILQRKRDEGRYQQWLGRSISLLVTNALALAIKIRCMHPNIERMDAERVKLFASMTNLDCIPPSYPGGGVEIVEEDGGVEVEEPNSDDMNNPD